MTRLCVLFLLCVISLNLFAGEKSAYDFSWLDQDKEIYVLQNRKFRKDGKLYVGLGGVKTISGAFIDSYGGQARLGYFFKEDWGIEGLFGKGSGSENDTAKGVTGQGSIPFYRKVDQYMGAMLMWSPFYAKINTFNKVFYFDWMFGLGAAQVTTLDNRKKFDIAPSSDLTQDKNTGILWDTAIRFYMSESWSLRIDITGIHAKPSSLSRVKGVNKFNNYDLALGLNYSF